MNELEFKGVVCILYDAFGPTEMEKNAAEGEYLYELAKPSRDLAAFGPAFMKIAEVQNKDPWELVVDVANDFDFHQKAASTFPLSKFYMDWAEKVAALLPTTARVAERLSGLAHWTGPAVSSARAPSKAALNVVKSRVRGLPIVDVPGIPNFNKFTPLRSSAVTGGKAAPVAKLAPQVTGKASSEVQALVNRIPSAPNANLASGGKLDPLAGSAGSQAAKMDIPRPGEPRVIPAIPIPGKAVTHPLPAGMSRAESAAFQQQSVKNIDELAARIKKQGVPPPASVPTPGSVTPGSTAIKNPIAEGTNSNAVAQEAAAKAAPPPTETAPAKDKKNGLINTAKGVGMLAVGGLAAKGLYDMGAGAARSADRALSTPYPMP